MGEKFLDEIEAQIRTINVVISSSTAYKTGISL